MNQQDQITSISQLKERITELEELMSDVMKWLDVSVSSREATELCDRMEDLLLRGKKE